MDHSGALEGENFFPVETRRKRYEPKDDFYLEIREFKDSNGYPVGLLTTSFDS